ncbi:MAG: Amuc_1100 family pilus-like protein [Verrucomicrobiales bacterium]|nr:Amuc_1100 family pilus-like protein [Verrucomicrobiales bacterium]
MGWVKKNLGFVIGLAVAVVLLGAGVWYSLGTMADSNAADGDLQAKKGQLDELVKREVYPDQANIQLAKDEEQRVNDFIRDARKKFAVRQLPETLDNAAFKSLLESKITELSREAERAGVKLPDKYNFTFEEQRKQLQLPERTLLPLTSHLENLAAICRVLFDAKVHSVVTLKRSAVGTNEMGGTGDLLTKKVSTNSALGAVVYPYEVVFQGFSQELAKVFTGLINSQDSFVVKTLNVERGTLDGATPATPVAAAPMPGIPAGMDPILARRYGLFGRGAPQAPVAPPPATANRPGEVVLDEKPLRVTLGLEVVSLLPTKEKEGKEKGRGKEAPANGGSTQ